MRDWHGICVIRVNRGLRHYRLDHAARRKKGVRRMNKHQLLAIAGAAAAIGLFSSVPANAAVAPPLVPGQQDGAYITDGNTIVTYTGLNENQESYSPTATFPTPDGFTSATIYLTENGATSCTPSAATAGLGSCSDGFTMSRTRWTVIWTFSSSRMGLPHLNWPPSLATSRPTSRFLRRRALFKT